MTKIFAGLLVLVILYASGGYLLVFTTMRQNIRNDRSRLVENESNTNGKDIEYHSFAKSEIGNSVFLKNNAEFVWQGNRYDIVKQIVRNDSIRFYCIRDEMEESLYSSLGSDLSANSQSQSSNQPANSLTFKIFSIGFFLETNKMPPLKFEQASSLVYTILSTICSGYSLLFTPPPKNNLS